MTFRIARSLVAAILAVSLFGCASKVVRQDLDPSFWDTKEQIIAVGIAELPTPGHTMLGSQGLLDFAINKRNARALINHLETLKFDDYKEVVPELADALRAQGFKTKQVPGSLAIASLPEFEAGDQGNDKVYAERDFRSLRDKYGASRLLLVTVTTMGTERNYYGFLPIDAPAGRATAVGEMIDLASNEVTWRRLFVEKMAVAEPWDQEPDFPNVTQAVRKAALASRKAIPRAFDQTLAMKQQPKQ